MALHNSHRGAGAASRRFRGPWAATSAFSSTPRRLLLLSAALFGLLALLRFSPHTALDIRLRYRASNEQRSPSSHNARDYRNNAQKAPRVEAETSAEGLRRFAGYAVNPAYAPGDRREGGYREGRRKFRRELLYVEWRARVDALSAERAENGPWWARGELSWAEKGEAEESGEEWRMEEEQWVREEREGKLQDMPTGGNEGGSEGVSENEESDDSSLLAPGAAMAESADQNDESADYRYESADDKDESAGDRDESANNSLLRSSDTDGRLVVGEWEDGEEEEGEEEEGEEEKVEEEDGEGEDGEGEGGDDDYDSDEERGEEEKEGLGEDEEGEGDEDGEEGDAGDGGAGGESQFSQPGQQAPLPVAAAGDSVEAAAAWGRSGVPFPDVTETPAPSAADVPVPEVTETGDAADMTFPKSPRTVPRGGLDVRRSPEGPQTGLAGGSHERSLEGNQAPGGPHGLPSWAVMVTQREKWEEEAEREEARERDMDDSRVALAPLLVAMQVLGDGLAHGNETASIEVGDEDGRGEKRGGREGVRTIGEGGEEVKKGGETGEESVGREMVISDASRGRGQHMKVNRRWVGSQMGVLGAMGGMKDTGGMGRLLGRKKRFGGGEWRREDTGEGTKGVKGEREEDRKRDRDSEWGRRGRLLRGLDEEGSGEAGGEEGKRDAEDGMGERIDQSRGRTVGASEGVCEGVGEGVSTGMSEGGSEGIEGVGGDEGARGGEGISKRAEEVRGEEARGEEVREEEVRGEEARGEEVREEEVRGEEVSEEELKRRVGLLVWPMPALIAAVGRGEAAVSPLLQLSLVLGGREAGTGEEREEEEGEEGGCEWGNEEGSEAGSEYGSSRVGKEDAAQMASKEASREAAGRAAQQAALPSSAAGPSRKASGRAVLCAAFHRFLSSSLAPHRSLPALHTAHAGGGGDGGGGGRGGAGAREVGGGGEDGKGGQGQFLFARCRKLVGRLGHGPVSWWLRQVVLATWQLFTGWEERPHLSSRPSLSFTRESPRPHTHPTSTPQPLSFPLSQPPFSSSPTLSLPHPRRCPSPIPRQLEVGADESYMLTVGGAAPSQSPAVMDSPPTPNNPIPFPPAPDHSSPALDSATYPPHPPPLPFPPSPSQLEVGADESYVLTVGGAAPDHSSSAVIRIHANTTVGALRALETLSQLVRRDPASRLALLQGVPLTIHDRPRFPHRGVLLDTARHFHPVPFIERLLDSMSYAKLNVLHWHLVDAEAFPIETPSFPRLWKGAHSPHERYSLADMRHVVGYAAARGIVVIPEIDLPSHSKAWGVGYPALLPAFNCSEPLDVSNEFTFRVIQGVLTDLRAVFPSPTIHIGGDEVNA
ncbi:unnamed protein product, partial [Closterium sp. Naga37s-1]